MIDPASLIRRAVADVFRKVFGQEISESDVLVQPTNPEFQGDFTVLCFPMVRKSGKSPEETGKLIGDALMAPNGIVLGFNVVKGFLNLVLNPLVLNDHLSELIKDQKVDLPRKGKVMVEFSSPNTNKPIHLGHLRNNFLGDALSKILKAAGHDVVRVTLVNDRGIHICKSMAAYRQEGHGETPETSGIKGDHLVGKYYVLFDKIYKREVAELLQGGLAKERAEAEAPIYLQAQKMLRDWENGDKEIIDLWRMMNGWVYDGFDVTYKNIGIDFDHIYYESDTYLLGKDIVDEGLGKGVFFKKDDGSVWIDLKDEKLDEKLVLRADGTSVYITQDLGTADLKYKGFGCEKSIYVVGNEQDYHFKVLFVILKKLERPYSMGLHHLSYGMVDLPSGKMKSREGTVVDADEIVEEMIDTARRHTRELGKIEGLSTSEAEHLYRILGLGALKYFLLKVDSKKRMLFDPNESIQFQGHTGPFIQYTHARISAILRRANELKIEFLDFVSGNQLDMEESERKILLMISSCTEKIRESAKEYSPALLANYVFDLSKEYNRFYADVPIFNEADEFKRKRRIALSYLTGKTIKNSMGLLGIEVPDRM